MKELTETQIKELKQWHDKTVRKCKTCGNVCIITTQGEQK